MVLLLKLNLVQLKFHVHTIDLSRENVCSPNTLILRIFSPVLVLISKLLVVMYPLSISVTKLPPCLLIHLSLFRLLSVYF